MTTRSWQFMAVVVVLMNTGCAALMTELGAAPRRNGRSEVESATRAQDVSRLRALCDDASLGEVDKAPRKDACFELGSISLNVDTGDCATVVERSRKARMTSADRAGDPVEYYSRWAGRLAKCEQYDEIFERFAHLGEGGAASSGVKVLQRLERDGVPLFAAFERYARTHAGPAFLKLEHATAIPFAGNHLGNWLLQSGRRDQCALLARALTDAPEGARSGMLFYFSEASCKAEGTTLALSLLTAKNEAHRGAACTTLGTLGGPQVQPKVQLLAQADNFFMVTETVNGGRIYAVKVYPVRDACRDASTKIQLRSSAK